MKRTIKFAALALIIITIVAAVFITNAILTPKNKEFYVGVTYCGNSVDEAKLLVDKVRNYTNLFVLQSGSLMWNASAVYEIGDYAVNSGLHFAGYFSMQYGSYGASWLGNASQKWGSMFAGIYYGDEPAGKMLDSSADLTAYTEEQLQNNTQTLGDMLMKNQDGSISDGYTNYYLDGKIVVTQNTVPWPNDSFYNSSSGNVVFLSNTTVQTTTYYPNCSVTTHLNYWLYKFYANNRTRIETIDSGQNFFTLQNGSQLIAQLETYQQLQSKNPIPNYDAAAQAFCNGTSCRVNSLINCWQIQNRSFPVFTTDYGLYWWDYQSGYDMILAQLGWNNSVAQEIGLVRGAANLQGKDWGTIITWKYTRQPFLPNGEEMFEQLKASYECGASYVIVFNYVEGMSDSFGTLQEEHFTALERFWNDVVQNPKVTHGGVKAETVLVLPRNYGWGMRTSTDRIWGIWPADGDSEQIWATLQNELLIYGSKLDIVYEDSAHPVAGKYSQVIYWNQTG